MSAIVHLCVGDLFPSPYPLMHAISLMDNDTMKQISIAFKVNYSFSDDNGGCKGPGSLTGLSKDCPHHSALIRLSRMKQQERQCSRAVGK